MESNTSVSPVWSWDDLNLIPRRWRYFATSIFIDHETDNWNLHVQFSEDPSFDWTRMEEYANPLRSLPPFFHADSLG